MKKSNLPEGYSYKPLINELTIAKSEVHGNGLFATADIAADENLGISHYNILCTESIYDANLMNMVIEESKGNLLRTPLGGFINHSDITPNVKMENYDDCIYFFITTRDIKEGEELLIDYSRTPCVNSCDVSGAE